MSRDSRYIIQYEGPFPDNYLEQKSKEYGDYFDVWGYDTIKGERKYIPDDEIINIAKSHGDALQVLRLEDESKWEIIWEFKNK